MHSGEPGSRARAGPASSGTDGVHTCLLHPPPPPLTVCPPARCRACRWKTTVGRNEERPGHLNGVWGYWCGGRARAPARACTAPLCALAAAHHVPFTHTAPALSHTHCPAIPIPSNRRSTDGLGIFEYMLLVGGAHTARLRLRLDCVAPQSAAGQTGGRLALCGCMPSCLSASLPLPLLLTRRLRSFIRSRSG